MMQDYEMVALFIALFLFLVNCIVWVFVYYMVHNFHMKENAYREKNYEI